MGPIQRRITLPTTKKEEQKLALSLIETMTRPLAEVELKDGYQGALKELIEAKIAGQEIVVMEEEEETPVDIMTALKASIEKARSEAKGMAAATGKKAREAGVTPASEETRPAKKSRKKAAG